MQFIKTKLLLISSILLTILAQYTNDYAWAFIMAFATSLFITSCGYLIVNSDQKEPKKLTIATIEKECNVYTGMWGKPSVKLGEVLLVPKNGKLYAHVYKNNRYLGMIHHFTNTFDDKISKAIYAKDGFVFIEDNFEGFN